MREFDMDGACGNEYADPADRRFHAEPISCRGCGPTLRRIDASGARVPGDPIEEGRALLAGGGILAVKGLGGYHFAALAADESAVRRLRERKRRPAKPFACMFRDLRSLGRYCAADGTERRLLASAEAPIVLLRRGERRLPDAVAPRNAYVGALLPYTPLHHLLMEPFCHFIGQIRKSPSNFNYTLISNYYCPEEICFVDVIIAGKLNTL